MNYVKSCLIITMLLGVGYSQSAHLEIQNVNIHEGTLDIYMSNDVPVSGFQFQLGFNCGYVSGGPENICDDVCCSLSVLNATGGEIVPNDWLIGGNGSWNNIIGYSMSGNTIPIGEGILATISFTDYVSGEICISTYDSSTPTLSMPQILGESMTILTTTIGDCIFCDVVDDCGICEGDNSTCSGCTDSSASNYDENATIDDDSCEYNDDCEEVFNEGYELGAQSGDINLDGQHNILDIVTAVNMILNP